MRRLEQLIRSSGYFRQKAGRLKNFVALSGPDLWRIAYENVRSADSPNREQLLSLNGVGPETADSILLYAGQHPSFVVDAYTKRIAERHGMIAAGARYEEVRTLFQAGLAELNSSGARDQPRRGRALAFSHEPGFTFSPGPGVQRNARSVGRSRQEILPEMSAQVRGLPSEPSSPGQWPRVGETELASIAPDRCPIHKNIINASKSVFFTFIQSIQHNLAKSQTSSRSPAPIAGSSSSSWRS